MRSPFKKLFVATVQETEYEELKDTVRETEVDITDGIDRMNMSSCWDCVSTVLSCEVLEHW